MARVGSSPREREENAPSRAFVNGPVYAADAKFLIVDIAQLVSPLLAGFFNGGTMKERILKTLRELDDSPLVVIAAVVAAIGAYKSVSGDAIGGYVMVAGMSFFIGSIMGRILK